MLCAEHHPFLEPGLAGNCEASKRDRQEEEWQQQHFGERRWLRKDGYAPRDTSIKGLLMGNLVRLAPTNPISEENKPLKFFFDDNTTADLWLAVARDE